MTRNIKNKINERLTKYFSDFKKKFGIKALKIMPIKTGTVVIKKIFIIISFMEYLKSKLSPVIIGFIYDSTNTYFYSLLSMALLCIASSFLILLIKSPITKKDL